MRLDFLVRFTHLAKEIWTSVYKQTIAHSLPKFDAEKFGFEKMFQK
jgi:hypothetical protein